MQAKLQEIGISIRRRPYLLERMFPRFREQIGTALDLIVEFSTLGEYRLAVESPGASSAPVDAPSQAPQMGGASATALRAAVRRTVAGGAAGTTPVATPAARRLVEYRLAADGPGASSALAEAPGQAPQLGGAGPLTLRAAVRRTVAGGPTGHAPVATPAARRLRSAAAPRSRVRAGAPKASEQLCLAV